MADAADPTGLITIPPGLDICASQQDLNLFLQLVNYNLEFLAKISTETFDTTVELPGVSEITIPGYQTEITSNKPALDTAWIGGRYPLTSPEARKVAHGKINGFTLPGVPPLDFTFTQLMYNIEILADLVQEMEDLKLSAVLPLFNPCLQQSSGDGGDIGGVIPTDSSTGSAVDRINRIFEKARQILVDNEGGGVDPCDVFLGFDDASWTETPGGGNPNESSIVSHDEWQVDRTITGGGSSLWTMEKSFDSADWPAECAGGDNLHLEVELSASIFDIGGGVPSVSTSVWDGGSLLGAETQVGVVGTQTGTFSFDFPAPSTPQIRFEIFINGSCQGRGHASIIDFSLT